MATTELLQGLFEATVAGSVAVLVVLALRRPLRAGFGAGVAYAAWLAVPVALVAVLLPGPQLPVLTMPVMSAARGIPTLLHSGGTHAPAVQGGWLLAAWAAGMLAIGLLFSVRQRRFIHALGALRPHRDGKLAERCQGLPATIGWWRPEVVLPADFEARYSERQRALMLAHERAHVARGDPHANAAMTALRCVFWFNPLFHHAADRFRHDQELACDASVLARHPRMRRDYGEALLHAQCAGLQAPLGCHFGFGHPLKERIAMLGQSAPSPRRRALGRSLVAVLALGAGFGAWAAQSSGTLPPPPPAPPAPPAAPAPPAPPVYPKYAYEHNLNGKVVLVVDVAADGSVDDVTVERSEPKGIFDEAAVAAARNWRFTPSVKDGKAIAGRVRVPVEFRVDGNQ